MKFLRVAGKEGKIEHGGEDEVLEMVQRGREGKILADEGPEAVVCILEKSWPASVWVHATWLVIEGVESLRRGGGTLL